MSKKPRIVYTRSTGNTCEYNIYSVETKKCLGKIKGDNIKCYWEAFDTDKNFLMSGKRKKECMDYFREMDTKRLMATGGGIGFEKLSNKVAKNYEGDKVAPKYQHEYGKTYSKAEAKEVGDKVAGKVYWQQQGRKMADGGNTDKMNEYIRKKREDQEKEEEGKYFAPFRAFVYSGSDQFADFKTDDFHKAVKWAKETLEQQRIYRKSSENLWAIVDEFTPIEKRNNVIYAYSEVARFGEEDMKDMKFKNGGSMPSGSNGFYIVLASGSKKEYAVNSITEIPNIYFAMGTNGIDKGTPMVHHDNVLTSVFYANGTPVEAMPQYAGKDYYDFKKKMADGGNVAEDEDYYRVFRNNAGKDIAVKIVKNPIFGKFDYYVDGTLRGQFDSFAQARQEVNYENFDMYKDGGNLHSSEFYAKGGLVSKLTSNGLTIAGKYKFESQQGETFEVPITWYSEGAHSDKDIVDLWIDAYEELPNGKRIQEIFGAFETTVNGALNLAKGKTVRVVSAKGGYKGTMTRLGKFNEKTTNSSTSSTNKGDSASKMATGGGVQDSYNIKNIKIGDRIKDKDNNEADVWYNDGEKIEAQYISGASYTYRQKDFDNGEVRFLWANRNIMAKGGSVVTSIKDIPNFKEENEAGRITYRGLGMGKLSDDFYKIAGENGTRIKVSGKEYYITDTEFNTFSRDSSGKMRIKFDAPFRKFAEGGKTESKNYYIVTFGFNGDEGYQVVKSKPILASNENEAEIMLKDQFESYEGTSCDIITVEKQGGKMAKGGSVENKRLTNQEVFALLSKYKYILTMPIGQEIAFMKNKDLIFTPFGKKAGYIVSYSNDKEEIRQDEINIHASADGYKRKTLIIPITTQKIKEILYVNDYMFKKLGIMATGGNLHSSEFYKDGGEIVDTPKQSNIFIARYNGKKIELEAKSMFDAEKKAIEQLKVPKFKRGLLSVMNKQAYEKGDFQFN